MKDKYDLNHIWPVIVLIKITLSVKFCLTFRIECNCKSSESAFMDNLILEGTRYTPRIDFNRQRGKLIIEGRSIPENPGGFYDPIMHWIEEYFVKPKDFTRIDFKLEYINSGSSKYILALLRLLSDYYSKGHDIEVIWHYEEDDEAVLELGDHYKRTFSIPFKLEEII
jgi:hypothetical protein